MGNSCTCICIGGICIWCIFCILFVFFRCQLRTDLIGGEQPAGPDDGEAGGLAGLHHRQHGEHDQQDHDDGGRKMLVNLAKECWNQPCLGEEGGGCRTVTKPGGQACGGHLQGGFFHTFVIVIQLKKYSFIENMGKA